MTTDWGLRDHYVGSFKGQVLSLSPQIQIVDISHEIEQYDILHASFIVRNAFSNFPRGSVHFIGLTSNNAPRNDEKTAPLLAIKCMEHVFVGADSGIFSLIMGDEPAEVYKLRIGFEEGRANASTKVTETIAGILNGQPLKELGVVQENFTQSYLAQSIIDADGIRAIVLYIDDFGNAIINVTESEFEQVKKGRDVLIHFRRADYNIKKISKTYEDAIVGEIVAFFNEDGYLEVALNRASAAGLLGIKVMDPIRIQFYDKQAGENDF
jgi:S-adenosylmethionine hydrolase